VAKLMCSNIVVMPSP